MAKRDDTVRLSADAIKARLAAAEDRTDWAKVDAMSAAELEASIAAYPGDVVGEPDWTQAVAGLPARKDHINLRVDHDVVAWFRARGKGYQTLMNNVLRAYVASQQHGQRE